MNTQVLSKPIDNKKLKLNRKYQAIQIYKAYKLTTLQIMVKRRNEALRNQPSWKTIKVIKPSFMFKTKEENTLLGKRLRCLNLIPYTEYKIIYIQN